MDPVEIEEIMQELLYFLLNLLKKAFFLIMNSPLDLNDTLYPIRINLFSIH
jgi:hypothetical protein